MLLKSRSPKLPPAPLAIVEHKTQLKLLSVTFETDPVNWDMLIITDHVLRKASSGLHILRVCKCYGHPNPGEKPHRIFEDPQRSSKT